MKKIVQDTYRTYFNTAENRAENHWLRVGGTAAVALCFCVFAGRPPLDLNNMMITGLTILTGFTFTALFSDHSLADVGLPKPKNENDRQDLKRLGTLAHNFHARSRYFIFFSIIDVLILIARSIDFSLPSYLKVWGKKLIDVSQYDLSNLILVSRIAGDAVDKITIFISVFVFIECLYTFYRLSETIISIVNIRREYMKASSI